jgi:excisionase family DNA binding protein
MTDMLTAKDMQALLQVDRSTIYRMVEAGRLPAIKVGKQWRFPGDQVEQWLQRQASRSMPAAQPAPAQVNQNTLAELLPLECVQLIQDTFAKALEIMLVITNLEGRPITEVSNPCGLFKAISHVPDALEKCMETWRNLAVTIDLEPKFMPSHLGLLCARAMIRVGPELKGMVVAGGIAPETWPPEPDKLEAIADSFGVKPETLTEHLTEIFYLDSAAQAKLLSLLQRVANIVAHIVNERNVLLGKLDTIAELTR